MAPMTEASLFDACRVLFGPELTLSREFLCYLQPSGAKSAYRTRAKQTHPDSVTVGDPLSQKRQNVLFNDLTNAYKLIHSFLEQREKGYGLPPKRTGAYHPQPRKSPQNPSSSSKGTRSGAETFYSGDVPPRKLEFGIYLYYRGLIPYQALIAALVWQRGQRPSIGEIACRWGWLDETSMRLILGAKGPFSRFGQRAIRLGLLTPFQVQTLLRYQQNLHKRIGQYFVESALLTDEQIEAFAEEMKTHNLKVASGQKGRCGNTP